MPVASKTLTTAFRKLGLVQVDGHAERLDRLGQQDDAVVNIQRVVVEARPQRRRAQRQIAEKLPRAARA